MLDSRLNHVAPIVFIKKLLGISTNPVSSDGVNAANSRHQQEGLEESVGLKEE